jgi:hypothetical protein
VSPTTPSLVTPHHTRPTPGLLPSWAPLHAPLSRSGCQATTSRTPQVGLPPPSAGSSACTGTSCSSTTAPSSRQWHSPRSRPNVLSRKVAGGGAAANAGAHPQPHAGSQDNGNSKLLLPQLDRLHLAFKRSQVSPSASSSSQDQQFQHLPKSVIPTQPRVSEQLTKNCVALTPARASRNSASFTSLRSTRPQSQTPPCAWR